MKHTINKIIDIGHTIMFGRSPGPLTTKFIHNLGYVGISIFLSKFFVMLFQLFSGRLLGATSYGKLTLVLTISEFLYIPMAIVLTAMVKYLAEKKQEKNPIVSSALLISSIAIIVWSVIFFLFREQLANLLHINVNYFNIALMFAIGYVIWLFATKLTQGLEKMKTFGLINFIRSLLTFILLLIFFYIIGVEVKYAILASFLGYIISSLVIFKDLIKIRLSFDKRWLKRLLKYGLILFIGASFSIALKDVSKIFVNAFLGAKELGIYQAYTTVTFGITNLLMATFTTVFFPESSKRNKELIWGKIKSVLKYSYFIFIFVSMAAIPLIFLYGKDYPFSILYLLAFSFTAAFIFVYYIFSWYVASFGSKGAKYSTIAIIMGGIANVILSYSLIPIIGIYGAITAILTSYLIAMVYLISKIKTRLLKNESSIN